MSLLRELRRRNVIRAAGLYLVAAWLIVQIAETLLPIFDTPGWVLKVLVVVVALGFIPAVAFAWAFELTPAGLRRDAGPAAGDATAPAPVADRTARKLDIAVIVLLFAIGGLMVWQRGGDTPAATQAAADTLPSTPSASPGAVDGASAGAAPTGRAATATAPAASIAVLPFVNMSADAENGYFADGISEELLNVLARIDGLSVASRTSSFSFKGKDVPIPEIAAALGVQHVLEGSVRKQGQRVRITAQLIRAGTDTHLWSQTWDRDLTDIFAVQAEIAQAIADELTGLLPTAPKIDVPVATADTEAYERFLRGRTRFYRRTELPEALADLRFAVERDPELAEAWVYLAAVQFVAPGYDNTLGEQATFAATEATMAEVRRRLPDHPLAHGILGAMAFERGRVADGLAALERAAALRSTDTTTTMWLGLSLLRTGYVREAEAVLARAVAADPLVGINVGYHAIARLALDGDLAAAEAGALRAAELGWTPGAFVVAIEANARGDTDRARRLLATVEDDFGGSGELASFRAAIGSKPVVAEYVRGLPADESLESLFAFGLYDEAFARWQRELDVEGVDSAMHWKLRTLWLPSVRAAREHPRFFAIADRLGLVEAWETRGYPDGCTRAGTAAEPRLACAETAR